MNSKITEIRSTQLRFFTKAYSYYKVAVEAVKTTGKVIENLLFDTPNVMTPSKDYHNKIIQELIDENNTLKLKVKELSASNDSVNSTNGASNSSNTIVEATEASIDEFGDVWHTLSSIRGKKRRVSFGNDEVRTFNVASDSASSKETEPAAEISDVNKMPVGWKPPPPPMPAPSATTARFVPPPPPPIIEPAQLNPVRINASALQQVQLKKTTSNENKPINKPINKISSSDIKKVKLRNMMPRSDKKARNEADKGASMQSAFKNALAAKFSHIHRDSIGSVKDDDDADDWM